MPDNPQPSRIEELLHQLLTNQAAIQISGQSVIGPPASAMVTGSPQIIIPADGGRLLGIGNQSPQPVFLAVDFTAIAGKGIPLQGNTTQFFPLPEGVFVSAVSMGGNIDLSWQLFG